MIITMLTDLNNYLELVEEQKKEWLYNLLQFLGIDIILLEQLSQDLASEYLIKNHIYITDYPSIGALKVERRLEHDAPLEIVGEWAGPEFQIKRDEQNKMYYEISIECWSILDEGIEL